MNQNMNSIKQMTSIEKFKDLNNGKLPLTSDIVFKKVFSSNGNEHILKSLLEAILDTKIKKVVVLNPELPKNLYDSKAGVLDVKAEMDDDTIIDIEMQVANTHNIDKRSTFYMGNLINENMHSGNIYDSLKKVIVINILNFNYYKTNNYHNLAHMKFEPGNEETFVDMEYKEEETIATKYVEMHFIELPKFKKKNPEAKTMLEKWLWMISGEEDKINMEEKENKELKETSKIVNRMSMTQEEWDAYFSHLMAEMDYHDGIKYATEQGIKQGIEQGMEQGLEYKQKEILQQMLKMKIDEKTICEALQITTEKFEELKKEISNNI